MTDEEAIPAAAQHRHVSCVAAVVRVRDEGMHATEVGQLEGLGEREEVAVGVWPTTPSLTWLVGIMPQLCSRVKKKNK